MVRRTGLSRVLCMAGVDVLIGDQPGLRCMKTGFVNCTHTHTHTLGRLWNWADNNVLCEHACMCSFSVWLCAECMLKHDCTPFTLSVWSVSTSGNVARLQAPTSAQTKTMSPKQRFSPQPPSLSYSLPASLFLPPGTLSFFHFSSCTQSSSLSPYVNAFVSRVSVLEKILLTWGWSVRWVIPEGWELSAPARG